MKEARTHGEMQLLCWGLEEGRKVWCSGSLRIILTGVAESWLLLHALWHLPWRVPTQISVTFLMFWTFLRLPPVQQWLIGISLLVELKTWVIFVLLKERVTCFWKRMHLESLQAPRTKSHIFNIKMFLMVYKHPHNSSSSRNNCLVFSKHLDNTFV